MRVTEENFEKVAEIIGYLSEFMIKVHGTTGYTYLNLRDRIAAAQVGLDALDHYVNELKALDKLDTNSEESSIGF